MAKSKAGGQKNIEKKEAQSAHEIKLSSVKKLELKDIPGMPSN